VTKARPNPVCWSDGSIEGCRKRRWRRGLFCRPYACLRPTRTVRSTGRKVVAEAGYRMPKSGNKGSKGTATGESGNDGQGLKASDAMQ